MKYPRTVLIIALVGCAILAIIAGVLFNDPSAFLFAPAALLPDSTLNHSWNCSAQLYYLIGIGEILGILTLAFVIWQKRNIVLSWIFTGMAAVWCVLLIILYLRIQNSMKHFLQ